jgi:hypothetical protein
VGVSEEFQEAVETGKTMRVRIMLKDSMLVDPSLEQFYEMEKYAKSRISGLYVQHDGELLLYDEEAWNENYLNKQMVTVVNNFSSERVALLQQMVSCLYKEKVKFIKDEKKGKTTEHRNGISRKQIGVGVAVVGTFGAIAGVCTSQMPLVAGGALVVIAGIVISATDKE